MELDRLEETKNVAVIYTKLRMTEKIIKEMENRSLKPKQLARIMGVSTKKLKKVLEDERKMTIELFVSAMLVFGFDVSDWLNV